MSFALSIDGGKLEWSSVSLGTLFAQRRNCYSPSFLCMLWDVLRFGREAPKVGEAACMHATHVITLSRPTGLHACGTPMLMSQAGPHCPVPTQARHACQLPLNLPVHVSATVSTFSVFYRGYPTPNLYQASRVSERNI